MKALCKSCYIQCKAILQRSKNPTLIFQDVLFSKNLQFPQCKSIEINMGLFISNFIDVIQVQFFKSINLIFVDDY